MTSTKLMLFTSLAALLFFAGAASAQAPLRYCVETVAMPMSTPHPERGIHVDLARALEAELGREFELVWLPPGERYLPEAVLEGTCDIAPGVVAHPGQLARGGVPEGVVVTRPYAALGYLLVSAAGARPVRTLQEVDTARIGVETESVPIYLLKQRGFRTFVVDDYDAVIRAVAGGRVSYGYIWGPLAAWHSRDNRRVDLVQGFQSDDVWDVSLAVTDAGLRAELDRALERLGRKGEVEEIFARYGVPFLRPGEQLSLRVDLTEQW